MWWRHACMYREPLVLSCAELCCASVHACCKPADRQSACWLRCAGAGDTFGTSRRARYGDVWKTNLLGAPTVSQGRVNAPIRYATTHAHVRSCPHGLAAMLQQASLCHAGTARLPLPACK